MSRKTFWRKQPPAAKSGTAIDQKIGDLYGSCMDEKTVDSKGIAALKPELDRIDAVKDKQALIDEIAHVHMVGPNPLFNFYSSSDLHNADQVIANIDQGGLTLPDRDYYLKDDEKMKGIRQHFVEYMDEVFTLAAAKPGESGAASGMDAMSSRMRRRYCALKRRSPRRRWTARRGAIRRIAITR